MQEVLDVLYLWLKTGHIVFVVFWMAGLFMLPRQMIYMHPTAPGSEEEAAWARRTRLLGKIILGPSLIVVWVLGIALAFTLDAWGEGWLHAKLLLVVALSAFHGFMAANARKMGRGQRPLSEKQLRMWGEAPGILLVLIVALVVVKPF